MRGNCCLAAHSRNFFVRFLEGPPSYTHGKRKKAGDGINLIVHASNTSYVHEQDNKYSGVCNPIFLVGGDSTVGGNNSDFLHYCTEIVVLGLNMPSVSGRYPRSVPIVCGKGGRIEVSSRRRRQYGCECTFHLHRDQFPSLPGTLVFIPNYHLRVESVS